MDRFLRPQANELANLSLTPRKLFSSDRTPKQFIDQPNAVVVDNISFAIRPNLFDLPSSQHFLDAAAVDSLRLAG